MLKGIDKLLTGDLLKVLCDMGHGDELVIADANFPAETCAKRLIRLPGIDGVRAVKAIMSVFPLDTYTDDPAIVRGYNRPLSSRNIRPKLAKKSRTSEGDVVLKSFFMNSCLLP